MSGSPQSPPASRPLTHVERSSPAASDRASPDVRMPSTLETLQVARDVMTMSVPGAPPVSAPSSRGKPLLSSPQWSLVQHQFWSRECSQCRSPPSECSRHSPCGSPSTPSRLSGWVPSDRDSWHHSTPWSDYRRDRGRCRQRSSSHRGYRSQLQHGRRCRSRLESRSESPPRHRLRSPGHRSPAPCRRRSTHPSRLWSSSYRRYRSSASRSWSHGRHRSRHHCSSRAHDSSRSFVSPVPPPLTAQWCGQVSLTGTRTTVALPRNLHKRIAQVLDETFEEITEVDYCNVREHINALFRI
ncbi:hypothetical protein UY3_05523 [Chelonia mydas]|uniref:Uncharacterized protein n=1 Tax=Chelonia mydas TaxID=8469 RepID=M7BHB2_CHEMY|nr:hypothetical protein UY3_05523 [Chelonia mydas]